MTEKNTAADITFPLLFTLLGLVLTFHPTLFSSLMQVQVDLGDTRFNNFALEHAHRWFLGRRPTSSFWDFGIFHPSPNSAAYSDLLVGALPFYSPFRLLGLRADTAFQFWMMTVFVLNFACFYFFLRAHTWVSPVAGCLGAFLFAFGAPRVSQLHHQQMMPQFYSILALHSLIQCMKYYSDLKTARRYAYLVAGTVFLALQFYTAFYLGWFAVFGAIVVLVVALLFREPRGQIFRFVVWNWFALLLCAGLFLALMHPLLSHYQEVVIEIGYRPYHEIQSHLPPLKAWLLLSPQNWLYGALSESEIFSDVLLAHEKRLGIGFVTLGLSLYGLWAAWSVIWIRVVSLAAAITAVSITVFPGDVTAWWAFYLYLPGTAAVRAIGRIVLLLLIPAAIGLALGLQHFVELKRAQRYRLYASLLAVWVVLEQAQTTPSYGKQINWKNSTRIINAMRQSNLKCKAFLYSPVKGRFPPWKYHLDAMWTSMRTGLPTLNAHSGNYPPKWKLGDPIIHDEQSEREIEKAAVAWIQRKNLRNVCWVKRYPEYGGSYFVSQLP